LISQQSPNEYWLSHLQEHLKQERYCPQAAQRCTAVARRFLTYLNKRHIAVEVTEPSNVNLYLQNELRLFRQHHQRAPGSMVGWRTSHTRGIHMLLRLVQGQWPPIPVPSAPREIFHRELCKEYASWMCDVRGLALQTRSDCCAEAHRFLSWLEERGSRQNLLNTTVADVDTYMMFRARSQRRRSLKSTATRFRSFLGYLHITRRITLDLTTAVIGPTLYAFESIPSSLRSEDVKAVVEETRKDRSRKGLRDYAILMLLSSYGLRAGEVTALRLDDVDWRSEVIHIHHSKTGVRSELPLLAAVGNAILDYLRKGRPKVQAREIFIRNRAPYRPFQSGSSLYTPIRCRLEAAGVNPAGKRGPHAFRHARAVSVLRASVPAKEIGDVVGHRSVASSAAYLKLATEDLRAVALEIPGEVKA